MYYFRASVLKRNFEIILTIFLITFCCAVLLNHFLKSFDNINENLSNIADNIQNDLIYNTEPNFQNFNDNTQNDLMYSTEPPLKDRLKSLLKCRDHPLQMEKLQYGEYWLVKNYIRGRLSINMECAESVTYTTNGDYTFIENLATVAKRWLAPISFAIFSPGYDYNSTMDSIQYARNCLPESQLIRDYVTFHIYFPNNHMPSYIAIDEEEALEWPFDCQLAEAPYENVNRSDMYRTEANLTYPINVGRNIARKAANTYFIFACDIELYPSLGLVDKFLQMVVNNASEILEGEKRKVFPLPVFEIHENATLPNIKSELKEMLSNKMAIPFHQHVCANCHLVPKQNEWIKSNSTADLEIFSVTQRYGKFVTWEPFYISDNKEPLFDERVTWEGQSNKRIQNYAMCLMDYEYHVLHPAFLVHAPGIKRFNPKLNETQQRLKYAAAMNKVIKYTIIPEYLVLYGNNSKCKV